MHNTRTWTNFDTDIKVALLSQPGIYPFPTKTVEVIETYMSWLFFTDCHVFKLKKPIHSEIVDLRTPEARYKNCVIESKLNEPLGGDVYLGIVPLTAIEEGRLQIDREGKPVDWLVWMKRLPKEQMLHECIRNDQVTSHLLQSAAEKLTDFYLKAPTLTVPCHLFRERIRVDILKNQHALINPKLKLSSRQIKIIGGSLFHFLEHHEALLDTRARNKRIIETHGDLKPEHICLRPEPAIIDCLEFNRTLKIMDIAEELSYLCMECEALNNPVPGKLFLETYIRKSQDPIPDELIIFYKAKRSFLRAWLTSRHILKARTDKDKWSDLCALYMSLASAYCKLL